MDGHVYLYNFTRSHGRSVDGFNGNLKEYIKLFGWGKSDYIIVSANQYDDPKIRINDPYAVPENYKNNLTRDQWKVLKFCAQIYDTETENLAKKFLEATENDDKIVESGLTQEILDLLEEWCEDDMDPKRHLKLIEESKMNSHDATYVFASYMNNNTLTIDTVKMFIALGVNIDEISEGYATDGRYENALSTAAEYRRIEDIKVLLECGANINTRENIILTFVLGHSALYLQILNQEDLNSLQNGVKILIDAGANVTRVVIDFVRHEYYETEFSDLFEKYLEQIYFQDQITTWKHEVVVNARPLTLADLDGSKETFWNEIGFTDYKDDEQVRRSDWIIGEITFNEYKYTIIHGFPGDNASGIIYNSTNKEYYIIGEGMMEKDCASVQGSWYIEITNDVTEFYHSWWHNKK